MNIQETIIQLKELKLNGMAASFEAMMTLPLQNRPSVELAVAKMTDAERQDRRDKKTEMYLKTSKLRYSALLEDVICSAERNFTKDTLSVLSDCAFIRRHENLLIQGKCGCGKSFLICAIGRQACTLGLKTIYLNMNRFVERVTLSKLDGSFLKMITSLEKNDLIILDDFGLQPMDTNTRLALLQILEERYERKSVIIASQLPIEKWYEYIGDATLADAIMDRLVSNASKIELKGESMRQRKKI
jgi:DNA replication protein DnaC